MILYTIGSSKKSSEQFFECLKYHMVKLLVDVRLKNDSQLLGFTRQRDLPYPLKVICKCQYIHKAEYAPTAEILTGWKKKLITWDEYEEQFTALMNERKAVDDFLTCFEGVYDPVCLLCSEPTPEHCHRRLFAEMIHERQNDVEVVHL